MRSRYARRRWAESNSVTSGSELIAKGWNTGSSKAYKSQKLPRLPQTSFNHARMDAANREHDKRLVKAKASAQRDPNIIRGNIQRLTDMLKGKISR